MDCPQCSFKARSAAGLAAHQRWSHTEPRPGKPRRRREPGEDASPGANATAVEETLAALREMGRLERVDAARVQALRSMAAALDLNPFNSQMWREYREAIERLSADDSGDARSVDELLDELSS